MKPHYTDEEANDILRRAIEQTPVKPALSRDQLKGIAAEVGLSPGALIAAEAELSIDAANKVERSAFIASRRRWFLTHLALASVTVGFATAAIMASDMRDAWLSVGIPCLVIWGIVLAVHGFTALQTRGLAFEQKLARWRGFRALRGLTDEQLETFATALRKL